MWNIKYLYATNNKSNNNLSGRKYGVYINGCIIIYYFNGKLHHLNVPAIVSYYITGKISSEGYNINGKYHRLNRPAIIWYDRSGKITCKRIYINDNWIKK